ncbi:putative multidrug resistance protein [Escherichia coli]|uniref:Putative multidrug resistance protein n=1 Tax=Escherichia coli TaxID=562 RepID=A0A376U7S7_ECOLX|nr:putative multidrug resistance protein [Escherichia coli]
MTDLPDSTRWQLWIVAFGFFMQSLDTTIVNTALPSMAQSLGESPLHMHMVIVSYVLTVAVMLPASGWLAGQSRRAQYFLYRHRAVYSRFTVLRAFRHAERTVAGTRVTGRWRRDDGAGRQIDGDENRTARAIYGGDDLCHVTRSGRSAARSGARRSAGGVRVVALDLFDQHSGGDYRCDRHIDVNAELYHADAALRSLRLFIAGGWHGGINPGAGRQ